MLQGQIPCMHEQNLHSLHLTKPFPADTVIDRVLSLVGLEEKGIFKVLFSQILARKLFNSCLSLYFSLIQQTYVNYK